MYLDLGKEKIDKMEIEDDPYLSCAGDPRPQPSHALIALSLPRPTTPVPIPIFALTLRHLLHP